MFGGLTFMVNDRMCCGVVKDDLVLRLTPERAAESLRKPHTRTMDFTGKPMNSMIYVSAAGTDSAEVLKSTRIWPMVFRVAVSWGRCLERRRHQVLFRLRNAKLACLVPPLCDCTGRPSEGFFRFTLRHPIL